MDTLSSLTNKRVILGITGSVAAYKAADLVRRLRDAGAEVRVVMTNGARAFVTPLTYQALSGNPVHETLLDTEAEAGMGHIELARWADVIVIAPASANSLAALAHGRADELLYAICLASEVPLAIAPAMNKHMWADEATKNNVRQLAQRGILFIGPDSGDQACGDVGSGRMVESEEIIEKVSDLFSTGSLSGKTVMVTAGPTREALDPVRFLSNHSSGKMGYAIAEAAMEAGARVILVSGPVDLATPERISRFDVVSAAEMENAVHENIHGVDIFIATAAVSDYRPVNVQPEKIKKDQSRMTLELEKNTDILAGVKQQYPQLFCVGFAAETQDLESYANKKLHEKNIEMIAANLVGHAATATEGTFNSDSNEITVYWKNGKMKLGLGNKTRLARDLVALIAQRLSVKQTADESSNVVSLKSI